MRWIVVLALLWGMGACISNDVPYPVIYGNVTKFEVNGQQKCVINIKTRTIELTLSDTVDIHRVRLNTLELSADPARAQEVSVIPEATIAPDTFLNLSKPLSFTIHTYQDYEWTVTTEQPVERFFKVENQVGEEIINVQEKMVLVYVNKNQRLSDIHIVDLQLGPSIATYAPDPRSLRDFIRKQTILMTCFGRTEAWEIGVFYKETEETLTVDVNAFARFAYVSCNLPSEMNGTPAFEYKPKGGEGWTRVEAAVQGKSFTAKIEGLTANKAYVVRSMVGENAGDEVSFTTESEEQIEYSNFDTWYTRSINNREYATPGVEGRTIWDTGNQGGAAFNQIPTTVETEDVVKGSAARLASRWAVMKFAAGSVFTGKFAGLDGLNAKLDFGIQYSCRPTKLKGYYKYHSGVVDRVPDKYKWFEGKRDSCHIYCVLADWSEAFHANSKTETFIDFSENNTSIIAFGELKNDRRMPEYEAFSIDLVYRDLTRKPTYIVIVASASKFGDYFAGSTESVLLVDEFELGFD